VELRVKQYLKSQIRRNSVTKVKPKKKLEDKLPYKDDFGSKYVLSGIEAAREIAA
jgi:hypothetical protein